MTVAPRAGRDGGSRVVDAGTRASRTGQPKLEFRTEDSWNLHYAGNRGAEGLDAHGSVTIELDAGGRSVAVDSGKRVHSVLFGDYTETSTEWRVTWRGTWATDKDGLHVDLTRSHASCEVTKTKSQGATQYSPSKSTCSAGVAHLALECKKGSVDAAPSSDDLTRPKPTPVWFCDPAQRPQPKIGTSFPWVFGIRQCLERSGGGPHSGRFRYAHCKARTGGSD